MCYQTFGVLKKPRYVWEGEEEEEGEGGEGEYEVVGEELGFCYERIGEGGGGGEKVLGR